MLAVTIGNVEVTLLEIACIVRYPASFVNDLKITKLKIIVFTSTVKGKYKKACVGCY